MLEIVGLGEAAPTLTLAEADRVGSAEEVAVTVIAPGDCAGAT
jgi:acetyl-CoA carboxylase alpha subunit